MTQEIRPCPRCRARGVHQAVELHREFGGDAPHRPGALPGDTSMWRWRSLLPELPDPVSLGEGGTPLVPLRHLPGVRIKDERANPTGSFKDRMASLAVSWARDRGFGTVAVASTGNAAVSTAAYAAAAGLRCVILAKEGAMASPGTERSLRAMGAEVRFTDTWHARWTELERGVRDRGWFPVGNYGVPPVSSHPVGVRAYRTLAYEIAEQRGWTVPDWITVPVSRGDALCGLVAGFDELRLLGWITRVPRMLAVVRFPSLRDAVRDGVEQPEPSPYPDTVAALSISDPQATAGAARAVRHSGGDVLVTDDATLTAAHAEAAAHGHLVELSSAAALAGATALRRRGDEGDIVALITARG
ncbi:pyridoxal-phosphate dependent enzyme [Streptomyces californicus]|uniref:pyridoxal-phosphate dependent enzyme n=1 Tax=Streptomyces californicus TaxID=67351 RepID=UPI00378B6AEA